MNLWLILVLGCGAALSVQAAEAADWRDAYRPTGESWKHVAQDFIFNNEAEPETLDPARATGVLEDRILRGIFEGLVINDPLTLEPRPGVAQSWERSADGLQYTFHLRSDARWSDGKPVTAEDFRRSWLRVITPATAADYAALMYPIVQAEAFHQGQQTDSAAVGIRVIDAVTLQVDLHQPCAWFLDLCAFMAFLPVPEQPIAVYGERWTRPEHIIGNGPFTLKTWAQRDRIVMIKSQTYWDRDFVKLQSITALPLTDSETAYKRFLAGDLHWMATVPVAKIDEVRLQPDYYVAPYFGTYFYRLNTAKPPLDDVHVRRALSYAIDRRQITEQVIKGGQMPVGSLCPPVVGYEPIAGPSYNVQRAREELSKSRYAGTAMPPIELLFNTSDQHKQIAEVVARQIKETLGIHIDARSSEWKTYLAAQNRGDYTMCRASWIGDYSDPDTFFGLFVTDGGHNRTGWSNPAYDALVQQARSESDSAARWAMYQQAEQLLVEDGAPIITIYRYVAQGLLAESVVGFEHNIRDVHPWQCLWLD